MNVSCNGSSFDRLSMTGFDRGCPGFIEGLRM